MYTSNEYFSCGKVSAMSVLGLRIIKNVLNPVTNEWLSRGAACGHINAQSAALSRSSHWVRSTSAKTKGLD